MNSIRNNLPTARAILIGGVCVLGAAIIGYGIYRLIKYCSETTQSTAGKADSAFRPHPFLMTCGKKLSGICRFPCQCLSSVRTAITAFCERKQLENANKELFDKAFGNDPETIFRGSSTIPDTRETKNFEEIRERQAFVEISKNSVHPDISSFQFDQKYRKSQLITRLLVELKTFTIPLSNEEKNKLIEAQEELKKLESGLNKTYGKDFSKLGWHGRQSFQRIIFQDSHAIKAFQNPLLIKAILLKRIEKTEINLADNQSNQVTLSELLLGGLSSNRLSYLTTVAPNWDTEPEVDGVKITLNSMKTYNPVKEKKPRQISEDYLKSIDKSFATLNNVFDEVATANTLETNIYREAVMQHISQASVKQLIDVFSELINTKERIAMITCGVAGASTQPIAMYTQCLDVMNYYQDLLEAYKGDHASVIGFGLVSHAIDARHLAAAIYYSITAPKLIDLKKSKALEAFLNLIDLAQVGKLDKHVEELIRIRLQQIMTVIVSKRKDLKIDTDEECTTICNSFVKFKRHKKSVE